MGISTGRGDDGTTSLAGGGRVRKDDPRVEAAGSLDEAAAALGAARGAVTDAEVAGLLRFAHHRILNCSARVATPPAARGPETPEVSAADVAVLEAATGRFMASAGPLAGFVMGADTPASAALHLARTAVRRAERRVTTLGEEHETDLCRFLNRLSDTLFAAARRCAGGGEELWDPRAPAPED